MLSLCTITSVNTRHQSENRHTSIIMRYDYSEPQKGKDICDHKIAVMKTHLSRYINEGHDVITASDMKEGLESYVGVSQCYAAVVEVEVQESLRSTWPGV